MMSRKALLREFLKEEQEPFHLKTHISTGRGHRLRPGACFRDATVKSLPLSSFKAAVRIVPQRESRIKKVGLGFVSSFFKILKDRIKKQRRDINSNFGSLEKRSCPRQKEDLTIEEEDSDDVNRVEEENEECSPVSVLDPFLEDHDHQYEHHVIEEEDKYANVQRVTQQLLDRLRRFEKLEEVDPLELEINLLEDSTDEYQRSEGEVSKDDDHVQSSSSTCAKQHVGRLLPNEVFFSSRKYLSTQKMRLLGPDHLTVQKKRGVICNPKEGEFYMVYMMVELDSNRGFDSYEKVVETIQEMELAIFDQLVEELICI